MVFVQETFERAKAWVKELQRQASPNIVIALSGNKADLAEKRLVEYEVTHSSLPTLWPHTPHLELSPFLRVDPGHFVPLSLLGEPVVFEEGWV